MHLLEVLRELCGITSPKDGCSPQGTCGCCTVLVDGRPGARLPEESRTEVAGREVITLEGIPEAQRQVLARAFVQEGAVQCGFCTPGIVTARRPPPRPRQGRRSRRGCATRARRPPVPLHRLPAHRRRHRRPRARRGPRAAASRAATPRRAELLRRGARPVARAGGSGQRRTVSASRRRATAASTQALGDKPFVADLQVPGMLHAAVVLAAHPRARVLRDRPGAGARAAGRRPGPHRGRRAGRAARRPDRPGLAGVRGRGRDSPAASATCWRSSSPTRSSAPGAPPPRCAVDYEVLEPVTDPEAALAPGAPRAPRRRQPPRGLRLRPRRRRRRAGGLGPRRRRDASRPSASSTPSWSPRRAWRCPHGDAAQGLLPGPGRARRPAPDRRRARRPARAASTSSSSPTAARSAARRTSRSRRRPRSRPACSAGRSGSC